ncbi:MAG: NAD-binding protein [Nitriliruptorales bacterium]|nr:NAD-binding protein [Nitriliruptorales bacterium]
MYVVIAGGGRIGRYIAKDLLAKRHDVTIIERVPGRAERLVAETDVLVIEGDACDVRYLEQAHLDRADVFVATTHEDDDNLVACQLAKVEFGVKRAIARVNTPKNVEIFETLDIEAVSSTRLISELLEHEFSVGELIHLTTLKGGRVSLVELRIPDGDDEAAPAEPRLVRDLGLPFEAVLVAFFRGDETIIPRGETEVRPGDEVVVLTTPELEDTVSSLLLGEA